MDDLKFGGRNGASRIRWSAFGFSVVIACAVFGLTDERTLFSQTPATVIATSPNEDLATKRAKLSDRIQKLSRVEVSDPPANNPETKEASHAEEELEVLRSLDLLYLQHQATLEYRAELEAEKKRLGEELDSLRSLGPAESKPYSFLLLEDIRDQLAAEEDRLESTENDLSAAQEMLQTARENFEESERDRREVREELEDTESEEKKTELAHELRLAELESTLAQETVSLRRAEIEIKTLRQELCKTRQTYFEEKAERIQKDVRFTERDYRSRQAELIKQRDDLRRTLKDTERQLQQLEGQQAAILRQLENESAAKSLVASAREAFQLVRRAHHEQITMLQQRLGEVDHYRHFLTCRYEVVNKTASKEDVRDWREQLEELLERLSQTERALILRMDEIRVDQTTLYRKSQQAAEQDPQIVTWITLQTSELRKLVDLCEISLVQLKSGQRMLKRLSDDLQEASETSLGPNWVETAEESLTKFWHYEIASVDDRPITIGKVVSGLFFLIVGILLARLASRLIGRSLLPRLGLNEGASHAVQSILFYSLCVVFGLLSLELVNLPFAAFTFLGGAVAIGIGFGSQNILNNFFSGLILLAEQPIRVGDLVEIDGVCGTVEHIGARSTRVKTASNHEIIVPNSKLLENKVTNLTLTDDLVQTVIGVSLSPVLPVSEIRRLLLTAALSHPRVLRKPEPVVLFKEFSNSSVSFELHFSLKLHSVMEARTVESEVREEISHLLRNTDAATTAGSLSKATSTSRLLRDAG